MSALASLRVLDLTDAAAVYGTKLLSDLGADVVRVEPPGGDPLRTRPPLVEGVSLAHAYLNSGKRSVVLDVDAADGRAVLDDLLGWAELVVWSGPAARWDALDLAGGPGEPGPTSVVCVTPFGLTGPYRGWILDDLVAWAMGGLLLTNGDPDRRPVAPVPGAELALVHAGMFAAHAGLAAVRVARRSGSGRLVDVSVHDTVLAATGEYGVPVFLDDGITRERSGSRSALTAAFGLFPTSDGHASVVCALPGLWASLAAWVAERTEHDVITSEAFAGGPQARAGDLVPMLNGWVEDLTRQYPKQELFEEGQRRGVAVTPVNELAAVVADPQLDERGFWVDLDVGATTVRFPGAPYRIGSVPVEVRPAPRPGAHTEAVLVDAGLDGSRIDRLRAAGVIG